jgi:hypothetical protein
MVFDSFRELAVIAPLLVVSPNFQSYQEMFSHLLRNFAATAYSRFPQPL